MKNQAVLPARFFRARPSFPDAVLDNGTIKSGVQADVLFWGVIALRVLIRLRQWFRISGPLGSQMSDMDRARALLEAIDRGGVPSDPVRINAIARSLGLDVSRRATISDTVERIRQAVLRHDTRGF